MRFEIVNETDFAIKELNLLENRPKNHWHSYKKFFVFRKQSVN